MVTEESIPDLLARLEREHVRYAPQHCSCGKLYPCDTARLVAHAKSLEREVQQTREVAMDYADLYLDSQNATPVGGAI